MTELLEALLDPRFPFLRYALLAGVLASVPLGIVGSYVVTRRITYIAGAISHCTSSGESSTEEVTKCSTTSTSLFASVSRF